MRDSFSKSGARVFAFDSITEVNDYLVTSAKRRHEREHGNDASFVGRKMPTWADVEKACVSEWPEGQKTLVRFVSDLESADIPEVKDKKRHVRFSADDGDELDLDRLRGGQDYWRLSKREDMPGPAEVTIVIDVTTPSYVRHNDILWRGAAAVALAKILEERGYRCEVWLTNSNRAFSNTSYNVIEAVRLKRCSDPLDVSTLVNSVSGWYYRSVVFTLILSVVEKTGNKAYDRRLGSCTTPSQDDLDEISRDVNRVYCAGVFDYNAALAMVRAELDKVAHVNDRA